MNDLEYEARKQATIALITAAFDGVERGDGVTLHEGIVIDDHASEEERAEARKLDTESRWQDVPYEHISYGGDALYFFEPESFHYYLSAYLVWYVQYMDSEDSNTFILDGFLEGNGSIEDDYYQARFTRLTQKQSHAVAQCLTFIALHQKEWVEREAASLETVQQTMLARGEWTHEEVESSKAAYRSFRESNINYETATRALKRYWGQFL